MRASAKNFSRVVPCHNIEQLSAVVSSMDDENRIPENLAKKLACETFFFVSQYDSTIAHWLWSGEFFPKSFAYGGSSEKMP